MQKIHLQVNEFFDKNGRVEEADEENVYTFLAVENIEQTVDFMNKNENYYSVVFDLSNSKKILKRRAYTTLDFLDYAGGVYASILGFAYLVNLALTSVHQESLTILHDHFKVHSNTSSRAISVKQSENKFGYWLMSVGCFALLKPCITRCSSKQRRYMRLIDLADSQISKALDLKTLLRQYSLVYALLNSVFEPKHL